MFMTTKRGRPRKPDTTIIHIRVPVSLKQRIEAMAEVEGRTHGNMAVRLLQEADRQRMAAVAEVRS